MEGILQRIHHLGYVVPSIEPIVKLYGDLWKARLGFHNIIEHRGLEIAWFYVGNNIVEFIRPLNNNCQETEFLRSHGPSLHHVAFLVEDIERALDVLEMKKLPKSELHIRLSDVGNWRVLTLPKELTSGIITQLVDFRRGM